MCDYSLMALPNRLATAGEELVVHRFMLGSVGFTCSSDFAAAKHSGFFTRLKRLFDVLPKERCTAICVPPGARLVLRDIPRAVRRAAGIDSRAEEVVFTQLDLVGYRDAIRFPNGVEVLLQKLYEGQRARVLSLSSEENEPEEIPHAELINNS